MINIEFTHQNKSGATSKLFTVPTEDISTDAKLPNQARQIAQYAAQYVDTHSAPFTFGALAAYIDETHPSEFTTSKYGTVAIIRYYSKDLQAAGIFLSA